ncbi:LysR family transcriptional regulator [Salipiger mangrovisoli]|uniref:LysR family transcriptional regulator n=1 Tax=Salipiger mangrovisoli TaxID=2865933 RepID=A0ABR9WYI5_9RHOB|nr:LysR family transcriptional regulator [Salipiger mangrovisoli]MBE9636359.1 LysR family transcriptional regulator [Salipiger mangrovisoli]
MISRNLRHLRVFLAVLELRSLTLASARMRISQPAVTQALAKLESQTRGPLFDRTRQGVFATERGQLLGARVTRAFGRLDPALAALSPRLCLTASSSQLAALIAVVDTENFTLAARSLGQAQPTVHRAISQLETEAGQRLFERRRNGLVASRAAERLAQAARLAFAELGQAEADMAEIDGREVGQIVIGALPMARSVLLPQAVAEFRAQRPHQPIRIVDGLYDDLLVGLRRGAIDLILGALRDPAPIGDVVQERLFDDQLVIVARPGHPLAQAGPLSAATLAQQSWVVPREGTPSRVQFDGYFARLPEGGPRGVIEAGSILFMRELLARGDFLGCISEAQAVAEISNGTLHRLEVDGGWKDRPIGLTLRSGWMPTQAQRLLLERLRSAAAGIGR